MGTNYYWLDNSCQHCGRSDDRIHVGKSSAGWEFSFAGHRNLEPPIESMKDWLKVLGREDGHIEDEYGNTVLLEELLDLIAAKRGQICSARIARLADLRDAERHYMDLHPKDFGGYREPYPNYWLDPDGNGFYGGEFS